MEKLVEKIDNFLNEEDNNIITISCGSQKLTKNRQSQMRYGFTLNDIRNEYGSITNLLKTLPDKNFSEKVVLSFRKFYGQPGRYTYHVKDEFTVNIKRKENTPKTTQLEEKQSTMEIANTPMNQPPIVGLGYTPVANGEWLEAKVKESRYNDLEREMKRVQEDLLDTRSKLRIKEEEYALLKMKYDTEQERSELKLERDRLERKGFFESEGFQKVMPALGVVLEKVVSNSTPTPNMLGEPQGELSTLKQQLIAYIQRPDCTEEKASLLLLVLQNFNDELSATILQELKCTGN